MLPRLRGVASYPFSVRRTHSATPPRKPRAPNVPRTISFFMLLAVMRTFPDGEINMTKQEQNIVQRALWESARVVATRAGADAADFFADDAAADELTSAILRVARRLAVPTTSPNEAEMTGGLTRALATIERGASYANGEPRLAERQRSRGASRYPLTEPALDETFLLNDATTQPSADDQSGYRTLWEGLRIALEAAAAGGCEAWLAALKRYSWAVPAAGGVSLYEQARTTAALAVCLHRAGWEAAALAEYEAALDEANQPNHAKALQRPVAWLVKGDLSGVQDFLYLLTSAGAARGLRGRSFYLQLLTETLAAWVLCESGDVPPVNVLYAGGGHFYLLLPADAVAEADWDKLRQWLATTLWQAHAGDLGATLARVPLTAHDLLTVDGLADRWQTLAETSSQLKQRKWLELGHAEMFERLFEPQDHGTTPEKMCQVCQHEWDASRDQWQDEIRKCSRCFGFEDLGKQLRDVKHLVRFAVTPQPLAQDINWQTILAAFGQHVELVASDTPAPALPDGAASVVVERIWAKERMPDWEPAERECFDWPGVTASYGWRLLAQATPSKTGENGQPVVAEFSDLAEASDGAQWLGVLRMDVDDLGEVLRAGLPQGLQRHATLARLSELSETLRLFFEGWVPQLCARYNGGASGDQVYLIYAGGDDLFVVGAWSALPQLARQIRDDFARFVGGQHITVSAGIAIEHAKYPLYQLAETAGHALDAGAKGYRPEKDALHFLGQGVAWEEFAQVERWYGKLSGMLRHSAQPLPRNFLTRLGEIHSLYETNAQHHWRRQQAGVITLAQLDEERHYAQWQWRTVYHLGRFGERYKSHQATIRDFEQHLAREKDSLMPHLRVIARWTELQTRGDRV